MRIAFAVNGTRGDVQPAMVLATALLARGHEVRFGVPPNLVPFAADTGLDVRPIGLDTRVQMQSVTRARAAAGRNPIRRLRALADVRDLGWNEIVDDTAELMRDCDAVVVGFTTEQATAAQAERLGIPMISLHHAPVRPNGRVGPLPSVGTRGPAAMHRAQWSLVNGVFTLATRGRDARLRAQPGCSPATGSWLSRINRTPGIEIQAYDPVFAPAADRRWQRDSRSRPRPVTGFIDLPDELRRRIEPESANSGGGDLRAWLQQGSPPLYIGFGSMPIRDPDTVFATALEVGRRVGRRMLICIGWNHLSADLLAGAAADDVKVVETADHGLFADCAAVIHHGGAGTTATALRAGVPSVICWFGSDQPFWGNELQKLGLGVSMPFRRFDAERLEAAVHTALEPEVRSRAVAFAATLVPGDRAVARAVAEIESATGGIGSHQEVAA
ncbi:glycosyltransferase [Gordonia sp. PKS22-38]|uniref:Glycosyltransferase n=1 Tax=Gordonia prachuapensis TaxID=3115651 RepID=A0ABU7MWS5_9ACTN|nr:glycosyltransferase [Gordonia sp. PKS22-38]